MVISMAVNAIAAASFMSRMFLMVSVSADDDCHAETARRGEMSGVSWVSRRVRFKQHPRLTACWIWTEGTNPAGYPYATYSGDRMTGRQAVYQAMRGQPAAGKLHTRCGEVLCVNPNHMNEATV